MLAAGEGNVRVLLLALAMAGASASTARAQATAPDEIAVPTRDVFDIVRDLRHKPPAEEPGTDEYKKLMVAVAPVVGYNPATGFSIGGAGNIAFFSGPPGTTRISSVVTSLTLTTKDQMNLNAKFNVLTPGNQWNLLSDDRLYLTNQDTYGLGTSTAPDAAVNVRFDYLRLHETSYRQVARNLFAGASLLYGSYRHIEPRPESAEDTAEGLYAPYSEGHGFDIGSQTSAGGGLNVLFDNRDSSINPSRGVLAAFDYEAYFKGFLKGTSDWQLVHYELRTYLRLTPDARRRLAFWAFGDLVTGGVPPYFDLPATGGDTYGRSGRGYTQGRFRGHQMMYGEAEYRWTLTSNGLLGIVAFLNAETLSNEQSGERLFDSVAVAGGAGLRLMLSKRSKTNLCLDYGVGEQGSKGVYFGVQEAF